MLVAAWSFFPLADLPGQQPIQVTSVPAQEPPVPLDEQDFRAAMLKQLRPPKPVVEQKPAVKEVPVQKVIDPPKITLIATLIGSGNASAVIKDPKNQTTRVRVGDRLSGGMITAIRPSELDFEFEGETLTITIANKSVQKTGESGG